MKKVSLFAVFVFFMQFGFSQIISKKERIDDINRMLSVQQNLIGAYAEQFFAIFNTQLTEDERLGLQFLYAYMPLSDMADYTPAFFLEHVRYSLRAKKELPWGKLIPEDEFLHFVLPQRVNNENLDEFRMLYYEELKNRVEGLSMYDAALEVNHWCHEKVTYKASDSRTSSPISTIRYTFGRCGEESVFTTAALRTVGIPARQVYTPRWAHSDDNHAWVEVWIDGKWRYLGACEPEPELDMGWFSFPASRTMLVHTRAYGRYFGNEEVIDNQLRFAELNLISNYAKTKKIYVKVQNLRNNPLSNAEVHFSLYNYAEFYPIAKIMTNENGFVSIALGLGDILVWSFVDGKYDFAKANVADSDTIVLVIPEQNKNNYSLDLDFTPPTGTFVEPYSGSKSELIRKRLMFEDSVRAVTMSFFKDSAESVSIVQKLGYQVSVGHFVERSYGNHAEIISFLEKTPSDMKDKAVQLLQQISEKDWRDVQAKTLLNHLNFCHSYSYYNLDNEMFVSFVLNCRIANEQMVGWRSFLQEHVSVLLKNPKPDAKSLVRWTKENITIDPIANMHSRAPLSPIGVYKLRVADEKSVNIFFVALCRSFGIPARLNPKTLIPEYYSDKTWQTVRFSNEVESVDSLSNVSFIESTRSINEKYNQTFSLSRLDGKYFQTLEFPFGQALSDMIGERFPLEKGDYLLVTGNRLKDGSVLTKLNFFEIQGSEIEIEVGNRKIEQKYAKTYGKIRVGKAKMIDFETQKDVNLSKMMRKKPTLLVFIDPDKEPSKHVLHDLALVKTDLEEWGGNILFVISGKHLSNAFNPKIFRNLPSQSLFLIDNEDIGVQFFENKRIGELPFVNLIDERQNIQFQSNGYRIGTGDEILRLVK